MPPWSSTRPLASASPRPRPPRLRSRLVSAWLKGSKMRSSVSRVMPMPLVADGDRGDAMSASTVMRTMMSFAPSLNLKLL